MEKSKKTSEFYAGLYYFNFQYESKDQLSNMLISAKNFCQCFKDKKSMKKLDLIYSDPIKYVLDEYEDRFTRNQKKRFRIKMALSSIEFLYVRDGNRTAKLTREYTLDVTKPSSRKFLTLDDIILIRGLVKNSISLIFTSVAVTNDVVFGLDLLPKVNIKDGGLTDGS